MKRLKLKTANCQPKHEISPTAASEVPEESNWISRYSQHGDPHEVDKSTWLVASLRKKKEEKKTGAGDELIRIESVSEGSKSA